MTQQKLPPLIRLYIRSCAIGFVAAAVFVVLLLWFDLAGLGGLVVRSDAGIVAVVMLWVFHGVVFAGVQFGYAIMSMAGSKSDDDDHGDGQGGGGGGGFAQSEATILIPIEDPAAGADRRRRH